MAPMRLSDPILGSPHRSATHHLDRDGTPFHTSGCFNLYVWTSSTPSSPKSILGPSSALSLITLWPTSRPYYPTFTDLVKTPQPIVSRGEIDGHLAPSGQNILLHWLIPTLSLWLLIFFLVSSEDLHTLIFEVIGVRAYRLLAKSFNIRGPFHTWRTFRNRSIAKRNALQTVQCKRRKLRHDLEYDTLPIPTKLRKALVPRPRRIFTITDSEPFRPLPVDDRGKATTIFAPVQDTFRIHPQLIINLGDASLSAQTPPDLGDVIDKHSCNEDIGATGMPDRVPWRLRP